MLLENLSWPSTRSDTNQALQPHGAGKRLEFHCTVKFLNFRMPENFSVNYLKFKQRGQNLRVFCQNDANGIANSEDPDQTAPLGAV